jgi:mannosyltransferase
MQVGKRSIPKAVEWSLILLLLLTGTFLALYHLDVQSLWIDEAYTWWFTNFSIPDLLENARIDAVHPPLYYLSVKWLTSWLGAEEAGLRLLSSLSYVLCIGAALILGYQVGGRPGRLIAGWFWVFHPMALSYARDARPYALVALFAFTSTIATIHLASKPKDSKLWNLLALISLICGFLIHYFFIIVVAGITLERVLEFRRRPLLFRKWTLLALLSSLPLILWILWFFQLENPSVGIGWIQQPQPVDLVWTFWNLLSGYGGMFSLPSLFFGVVAAFLFIVGIFSSCNSDTLRWVFPCWILFPLIAIWFVSQYRPIYVDRYFIVLFPAFLILISTGAREIWSKWEGLGDMRKELFSGVIILALGSIGLWSGWQVHSDLTYAHEDWRSLASRLRTNSTATDQIFLADPETIIPLHYYKIDIATRSDFSDIHACEGSCWWVLRQPYTATHAFSQSVTDIDRPWKTEIPMGCTLIEAFNSPTGVALWHIQCGTPNR